MLQIILRNKLISLGPCRLITVPYFSIQILCSIFPSSTFFSPLSFFLDFFPDFFSDFFLEFFPHFFLDFFPDYSPQLWSKSANIYMQTKWLQEFFVNMCSRKNSELKSRKKSGKKSWKKLRKKSRKKLRKKSGKKSTKKLRSLKPTTQALKMRTLFK